MNFLQLQNLGLGGYLRNQNGYLAYKKIILKNLGYPKYYLASILRRYMMRAAVTDWAIKNKAI